MVREGVRREVCISDGGSEEGGMQYAEIGGVGGLYAGVVEGVKRDVYRDGGRV